MNDRSYYPPESRTPKRVSIPQCRHCGGALLRDESVKTGLCTTCRREGRS